MNKIGFLTLVASIFLTASSYAQTAEVDDNLEGLEDEVDTGIMLELQDGEQDELEYELDDDESDTIEDLDDDSE